MSGDKRNSSASPPAAATTPTPAAAAAPAPEPGSDRIMKDVVAPPIFPLTKEQLFNRKGLPNLPVLKEHLQKEGRLALDAALKLIEAVGALFKQEPNMLELRYPITVCGDLHGQFFDLMRLFEVGGDPKDTQYLFLGDYVDRGCFSTEVVFYLYALKITYPKSFFMLRGNHECRQLTSFFNFKDECTYKYNLQLYDAIMLSFDNLPLAAIINKSFFCVHGGLSPDISTLEEVKSIDRFQEIPREGPMCDLLWSDPYEEGEEGAIKETDSAAPAGGAAATPAAAEPHTQQQQTSWYGYNETRQCSYVYGVEAVKQFLKDNKLTSIIRAHEAQVDGYKMQMVNKASGIPRVITIFSAPNYCDVYKNKAACLKFDNNVLNIKQFIDSPHPYYLPNFMDVFQWSLPFVAEKVTDMLANVLDYEQDSGSDSDTDEKDKEKAEDAAATAAATAATSAAQAATKQQPAAAAQLQPPQQGLLKKKVMAVSKILRMYKVLRQESELIVQLKQLTPSHKVPFGLLSKGPKAIKDVLTSFDSAKEADLVNEKRPDPSGASGNNSPAVSGSGPATPSSSDSGSSAMSSGSASSSSASNTASATSAKDKKSVATSILPKKKKSF